MQPYHTQINTHVKHSLDDTSADNM